MSVHAIKVMIVDDSIFFREFLQRALSAERGIQVVGVASDAFEATELIPQLKPDVITLDVEMPKMRGTDFIRQLKPHFPDIQVVVISALSTNVFEALAAGAVDFVSKPNTRPNFDNAAFIAEAVAKIRIASLSSSIKKGTVRQPARPATPPLRAENGKLSFANPKSVIAIGASTGGTEAILEIVKRLPANCPGVVIVQHMPPVFTNMYAERLNKICKMKAREAQDGDRVEPGLILVAAGDKHMRLKSDMQGYFVRCETGEKVSGHCPSVDVLFDSVAKTAGANAIGVILTGMGADGAKNLLKMREAGAYTIGQDQASCVVYGMPMVAYDSGAVCDQLPLASIADAIINKLTMI